MPKYDFLIVGAGLFGAVCARELTDRGYRCLVIDKRPHTAGNIYTEEEDGIQVHKYGAHIFHTSDKKVWEYVNRFAEWLPFINSPIARFGNETYNLPFNMNTFAKLWPDVVTPEEAKRRIEEDKASYQVEEPKNLEEQAIKLVGPTIYGKLIKGYTAKQWGRPCTELPPFIIKRIPVRFTYDNNYFSDRYQGIPKGGYTKFIEAILKGIEVRLGIDYFDCPELAKEARKTIFTGPIDRYFDYRFGPLEYRSLRFESETLDEENHQGVAVVNYTDAETPYTRIIEHKHFEPVETKKTIITREYPATWKVGDEPYYPVNNEKNNALYQRYKELADREKRVIFGGRLGAYKYFDMDDTVAAALELVTQITLD